jgi:hypothetical protein
VLQVWLAVLLVELLVLPVLEQPLPVLLVVLLEELLEQRQVEKIL